MKGNENHAGTGRERRLRSGNTLQSGDTKKLNERLHNTDRRRYKSAPTGVAADASWDKGVKRSSWSSIAFHCLLIACPKKISLSNRRATANCPPSTCQSASNREVPATFVSRQAAHREAITQLPWNAPCVRAAAVGMR